MSVLTMLKTPVVIQHMDDDYDVVDELSTNPDGSQLKGYYHPTTETENIVEQETYITTYMLYLPPSTPCTARDQALIDGKTLMLKSVLNWIHPRTQVPHHIECVCVDVNG